MRKGKDFLLFILREELVKRKGEDRGEPRRKELCIFTPGEMGKKGRHRTALPRGGQQEKNKVMAEEKIFLYLVIPHQGGEERVAHKLKGAHPGPPQKNGEKEGVRF